MPQLGEPDGPRVTPSEQAFALTAFDLVQRIRTDFLTGLLIVLPAFLTFSGLDGGGFRRRAGDPLVRAASRPDNIFGVGLVIFLVFATTVGAKAKGIFGRRLIHFGERMVDRIPAVRPTYNGAQRAVETIRSQAAGSFSTARPGGRQRSP